MKKIIYIIGFWAFSCALVAGCGGASQQGGSTGTPPEEMTPEAALGVIAEYKVKNGLKSAPASAPPSSMAEVFDILRADDVSRFKGALDFSAGAQGIDALYVRSMIELSWSGIQFGVANLFNEFVLRTNRELTLLEARKAKGIALDEAAKGRHAALTRSGEEMKAVSDALKVLAKGHLFSGGELTAEAIRQFPQKPDGYRARAHFHHQRAEWTLFAENMKQAERFGEPDALGMRYLRALERLQRLQIKDEARDMLTALRDEVPEFVRVQAWLVFVQADIEDTHAELQKLSTLSPNHPIVTIAGPVLVKEYNTAMELRNARR
jgi:hypothetical protein